MLLCQDLFISKIVVAQNIMRNLRLGMPFIQRNGPSDVAPFRKIFAIDIIFWNDMKLRQIECDSFYHILPWLFIEYQQNPPVLSEKQTIRGGGLLLTITENSLHRNMKKPESHYAEVC